MLKLMFTPSRVYCKYHYLEGHESDDPEIEIWKFLVNISKNLTDISKKQYTKEASETFSVESKYLLLLFRVRGFGLTGCAYEIVQHNAIGRY